MSEPGPARTVLVTGATGFIGSHLTEALVAAGHRVRCLVRGHRPPPAPAAETVTGDLQDEDSLARAVAGADWVLHLAGVTRGRTPQEYHRLNAGGTYKLLSACRRAAPGLSRLVLVSSQAAGGPSRGPRPRREDDPPAPLTPYGASKLEAERLALASGLPVVVLRPCTVYGPRDRDFLQYLRWVQRGWLPRLGRGPRRVSLLHVDDVVAAIQAAAAAPAPSGVYFVAGPRAHDWAEVEQAAQAALGRRARPLVVPAAAARLLALAGEAWGRVQGRGVILTRTRVAELLEGRWDCDGARAHRDWNWRPRRDLRTGIQQTVDWYETQGWL